jgi:long-chain acyl-CoA synthetase
VGLGTRLLRSYGELAGRAARLAGALRSRCGLQPGDRVAIAAKNSPDYLDVLYSIWHAGLAAVPANAKLHGEEFGYILEQSGARACFASADLADAIAPHAPQSLERLITIGSRDYDDLLSADAAAPAPRDADDLAWLFYTSGTTGRPGAPCQPSGAVGREPRLPVEVDPVAGGDAILHAAPMSRRYIMAHVARLGVNVVPEWERSGRGSLRPDRRLAAHLGVRGADRDQAPARLPGRLPSREHPHARVGRRADGHGRRLEGADRLTAAYRLRRASPMTITTLARRGCRPLSVLARAARLRRPLTCAEVMVSDADDRAPVGESGEIPAAATGDARLLGQSGCERGGAQGRLAAHRRRRRVRCRRLSHAQGPLRT